MPRAQDPTQSLLRWGIQNAAPGSLAETAQEIKDGKRPDLSTDVLKHIMGQSDADKMRECVMVIEGTWVDRDGTGEVKNSDDITDEDRYRAWEDLEMLVQDLDNANGAPCSLCAGTSELTSLIARAQTCRTWACGPSSSSTSRTTTTSRSCLRAGSAERRLR